MRRRMRFAATVASAAVTMTLVPAAPVAAHPWGDNRSNYTNGCTLSPDKIPWLIPLKDLCNQHDIWYARYDDWHHQFGTHEYGRYLADYYFYQSMANRCIWTYAWWDPRRGLCLSTAATYYYAVRNHGVAFYYDYNWAY